MLTGLAFTDPAGFFLVLGITIFIWLISGLFAGFLFISKDFKDLALLTGRTFTDPAGFFLVLSITIFLSGSLGVCLQASYFFSKDCFNLPVLT